MAAQLLDIQPTELKFVFELKKQSSCTVQLTNNTNQHVAFKVKTTSPKKYSVRPNVGSVLPKSTCQFTVTMQAQRSAPPDMVCKDKFLIQSTMVPGVVAEENITAAMFSREEGKHVEEVKLRVVLVSPPRSPVLSPMSGTLPQDPYASMLKEPPLRKIEIPTHRYSAHYTAANDIKQSSEEFKPVNNVDYEPPMYMVITEESKTNKTAELNPPMHINEESTLGKSAVLKPMMYMSINEKLSPEKEAELKTTVNVFGNKELNHVDNADLKSKNCIFIGDQLKPDHDAFLKSANTVVNGENLNPNGDADLESTNDEVDGRKVNTMEHLAGAEDLIPTMGESKPSNNEVANNNGINSEELKLRGGSNYCQSKDLELKNIEKLNMAKNLMNQLPNEELRDIENMGKMKKTCDSKNHLSDDVQLNVIKDIQEMKSKLNELESKLSKVNKVTGRRNNFTAKSGAYIEHSREKIIKRGSSFAELQGKLKKCPDGISFAFCFNGGSHQFGGWILIMCLKCMPRRNEG
ncbi:hypothetical protein ACFE04_006964 [Oxalis oulophora]